MSWRIHEPKFRPEEVAEILGVDRKAVMQLIDKRLIGYYRVGSRIRRIGLRHLRKYFSSIQGETERLGKERRAALRRMLHQKDGLVKRSGSRIARR